MGTPQQQFCDVPFRWQRRLEPGSDLGGDFSSSTVAPLVDAHHNSVASSSAGFYGFAGISRNQVFFPFQLPKCGFNQLRYPFVWESRMLQLPTCLQPMPVLFLD